MQLPLKIRIMQVFLQTHEPRLTASEIAKYADSPLNSVCYTLKGLEESVLLNKETNTITGKTYYTVNEFFLKPENLTQAREKLQPFIDFFLEYFYYPDDVEDSDIDLDVIDFITTIAWLFVNGTAKPLEAPPMPLGNSPTPAEIP